MSIYSCNICKREFTSQPALSAHGRAHSITKRKKPFISKICVLATRDEILTKNLDLYLTKLTNCRHCLVSFYPKHGTTFCSHSCSSIHNNKLRDYSASKGKEKLFKCVECHIEITRSIRSNTKRVKCHECKKKTLCDIKRPNTNTLKKLKDNERVCFHCKTVFESNIKRKYCSEHMELYSASAKGGYKFTFNIFNYPDLFDLERLKKVGFYCPGGRYSKNGKTNKAGLSRDHRVSVNEAILHSYDPYYIKHPLNCELMPHTTNNKKHTQSSISYDDLVRMVDEYDSNKPKIE